MSHDDLEDDFFSAHDPQTRADLFAEYDPDQQPAHAERKVFVVIAIVGAIALGVGYALMPSVDPPATAKTPAAAAAPSSAAAKSAPSLAAAPVQPASAQPASAAPATPRLSRLERLLKKNASAAGVAPSPPAAAPAPTFGEARAKIEAGAFDDALALLADQPEGFERASLRGWAFYELGRDADARTALRVALSSRPDHAESLLLLGSLEQDRDSEAAKETYRAFLVAHPKAPQADEVRQILERI